MAEIGTRKVFEDERVVVWHLDLPPGEQGDLHTHHRDYVVHIISGSTVEVTDADGAVLYTVEVESGSITHFRVQGDTIQPDRPGAPAIPATHRARNVGTETFSEVLIEFKR